MTNPALDPASLCLGHHDRPTEAQRPRLCDWCRGRLRGRLRALPALAVTVLADLGQQGAPPLGDRVTGSRERPVPGGRWLELMGPASPDDWVTPGEHRADQHDLQPVPAILASWARLIAEGRHLTLPKGLE